MSKHRIRVASPLPPQPTPREFARFWMSVRKTKTCWLWAGNVGANGYGQIWVAGTSRGVHRIAYLWLVGPIPDGLYVCHRCDNPLCVNPDHFFLGSNRENQLDSVRKGRHHISSKTHCPKGHPYSPDNTYLTRTTGRRHCRTCMRMRKRVVSAVLPEGA